MRYVYECMCRLCTHTNRHTHKAHLYAQHQYNWYRIRRHTSVHTEKQLLALHIFLFWKEVPEKREWEKERKKTRGAEKSGLRQRQEGKATRVLSNFIRRIHGIGKGKVSLRCVLSASTTIPLSTKQTLGKQSIRPKTILFVSRKNSYTHRREKKKFFFLLAPFSKVKSLLGNSCVCVCVVERLCVYNKWQRASQARPCYNLVNIIPMKKTSVRRSERTSGV